MSRDLPILAQQGAIVELLRLHQVLIVAGDTGSGKSTQLPQFCLEAGRGRERLIAHTQPRRIAARALAARIAEERGEVVGATVGFRVRFADAVTPSTRILMMTDGLLLAELARDPLLSRYDAVIVDEAHERTLNVDLLLGVLLRLLPRRRDLQVVVTSATLDVERIAKFFGGAPIVSVNGRLHPIELRYRTAVDDGEEADLPSAVLMAWRELEADAGVGGGDVLVFLPGEREIADVAELLGRELGAEIEVLPLYSRLTWEQQRRIFVRARDRRIVLSTNVAETSLTVPGIRAVIDSGLARVSRYSARSRLQRLPIEPVSRASADQRMGRCGRIGPGVCVRLYSEQDYLQRAPFTEPEVLRTNLAALLLRLAADNLGAAEQFPFIDPPDARTLNDGYRMLQELDALDMDLGITRIGRAMARLPLDPRLARALLESQRFRAEAELMAIVAALSVPDPRIAIQASEAEGPTEPAAYEHPKSEFLTLARLWRAYRKAREGPRRELRRWCKERRLSLQRLSEWENVYVQLRDRAAELGIVARDQAASYTGVHRSLLAGFATTVGSLGDEGAYLGTRGLRFYLLPRSTLKRRNPRWVLAANIVETSRVFARCVAVIEPAWIEAAAAHLIKREYLDVDWDERREEVVARERTSLLGLMLRNDRIVNYGPVAPEEARRIFAREALVYGRLVQRPRWLVHNDAAIRAAEQAEERLRRRDLVAAPETLVDFYAAALPRQVSSAATLAHFTRQLTADGLDQLALGPQTLFARIPSAAELDQYPERLVIDALAFVVAYRFAPGEPDDGALIRVALIALPLLEHARFEGAIPGFATVHLDALLRALPKDARRRLIPIAVCAAAAVAALGRAATDTGRLAAWLQAERGVPAGSVRFDADAVPAYLRAQFCIVDAGREIARGRNLRSLRRETAGAARAALDALTLTERTGDWRRYEAEELPVSRRMAIDAGEINVFPCLELRAGQVGMQLEWSLPEADRKTLRAAVELARISLDRVCRDLARRVVGNAPLLLLARNYTDGRELGDLLLRRALREACFPGGIVPRRRDEFERAVDLGRRELDAQFTAQCASALDWFTKARAVHALVADPRCRKLEAQAAETAAHLRALLSAPALVDAPREWITQLPRYLQAEERRWQRLCIRGTEPPQVLLELQQWDRRLRGLTDELNAEQRWLPELEELGWWVQEYRVSLTAQELRTRGPISAPRLEERAAGVEAWLRR